MVKIIIEDTAYQNLQTMYEIERMFIIHPTYAKAMGNRVKCAFYAKTIKENVDVLIDVKRIEKGSKVNLKYKIGEQEEKIWKNKKEVEETFKSIGFL